jgi:hypothetical protein
MMMKEEEEEEEEEEEKQRKEEGFKDIFPPAFRLRKALFPESPFWFCWMACLKEPLGV